VDTTKRKEMRQKARAIQESRNKPLALVHKIEGIVDFLEGLGVSQLQQTERGKQEKATKSKRKRADESIDVEFARHSVLDQLRQLSATTET
jgi:hypothetical protein